MAVWKLQYHHQPPSGRRLTTYMNGFVRTQHETSRIPYVHEAATEGKQACYICRVQERWRQYCDATTNNETLGALQAGGVHACASTFGVRLALSAGGGVQVDPIAVGSRASFGQGVRCEVLVSRQLANVPGVCLAGMHACGGGRNE